MGNLEDKGNVLGEWDRGTVLEFELMALHLLGRHSSTEPLCQPKKGNFLNKMEEESMS
jgi:hypothetical protein